MNGALLNQERNQAQTVSLRPATPLIRPAQPADALLATELIYLPMGRLADYLFGADDPGRARQVLHELFIRSTNRFSHQFCDVLEVDAKIVALLLAFPGTKLSELAVPTGQQLHEVLGWGGMLRLLRRSLPLLKGREAEADEFYIYTLAVLSEFQNFGLGAQLLAHAESKARALGLSKCSLGVTQTNHLAQRFYERYRYRVVESLSTPTLNQIIGYPGIHRMVKQLEGEFNLPR